jgi:hypothetical protein
MKWSFTMSATARVGVREKGNSEQMPANCPPFWSFTAQSGIQN